MIPALGSTIVYVSPEYGSVANGRPLARSCSTDTDPPVETHGKAMASRSEAVRFERKSANRHPFRGGGRVELLHSVVPVPVSMARSSPFCRTNPMPLCSYSGVTPLSWRATTLPSRAASNCLRALDAAHGRGRRLPEDQ